MGTGCCDRPSYICDLMYTTSFFGRGVYHRNRMAAGFDTLANSSTELKPSYVSNKTVYTLANTVDVLEMKVHTTYMTVLFSPLFSIDVFYALAFLILTKVVIAALESCTCALDEDSLRQNLERLGQFYDLEEIQNTCFEKDDVIRYYDKTTEFDYKILQLCSGIGLHSKLLYPMPICSIASTSAQAALVLKEIGHVRAKNVLEIGCGQGFCTIFWAALCPHVFFHGIDIVPRHIEITKKQNRD